MDVAWRRRCRLSRGAWPGACPPRSLTRTRTTTWSRRTRRPPRGRQSSPCPAPLAPSAPPSAGAPWALCLALVRPRASPARRLPPVQGLTCLPDRSAGSAAPRWPRQVEGLRPGGAGLLQGLRGALLLPVPQPLAAADRAVPARRPLLSARARTPWSPAWCRGCARWTTVRAAP